LQADSKRRKQRTHQHDGHRRALRKSAPHVGSLPRKQLHCVMCITQWSRERAFPVATSVLDVRLRLLKTQPEDVSTFASVSATRNMNIGAREVDFSQDQEQFPVFDCAPKCNVCARAIRSQAVSALISASMELESPLSSGSW
jgi:hypothetical protein